MRVLLLLLTVVIAGAAADDSWEKVTKLTSGTELRVYKRAGGQPVVARFDEASAENLIIVVKNEQVAISKQDIDRIDYRPSSKSSRVTSETKKTRNSDTRLPTPIERPGSTTTSSTVNVAGKPDFETVYRRSGAVK